MGILNALLLKPIVEVSEFTRKAPGWVVFPEVVDRLTQLEYPAVGLAD